jgi:hypothetical protein|tara:strand:+ start:432 stop:671 length:240 start_codon:yes stop_codon:yes gene_type:complete
MKHVITLGFMTLHLGAMSDAGEGLCEAISQTQIMIAHNLDIPLERVAELFKIVIKDLHEFGCLPEEVRDLISKMEGAKA